MKGSWGPDREHMGLQQRTVDVRCLLLPGLTDGRIGWLDEEVA